MNVDYSDLDASIARVALTEEARAKTTADVKVVLEIAKDKSLDERIEILTDRLHASAGKVREQSAYAVVICYLMSERDKLEQNNLSNALGKAYSGIVPFHTSNLT